MSLIAIHVAGRPVARLALDAETKVDDRDPDFELATAFSGEVEGIPGALFTDRNSLGSFLDGPARAAATAPGGTELTLSCGSSRHFHLSPTDPERGFRSPIRLVLDGVDLLIDEVAIGDLLDDTQRHFLARRPRQREEMRSRSGQDDTPS